MGGACCTAVREGNSNNKGVPRHPSTRSEKRRRRKAGEDPTAENHRDPEGTKEEPRENMITIVCPKQVELEVICGLCMAKLTEKSPWNRLRLVVVSEMAAVAVLTCGHSYHAECLEKFTSESLRFDPLCPVCEMGESEAALVSQKEVDEAMRGNRENGYEFEDEYYGMLGDFGVEGDVKTSPPIPLTHCCGCAHPISEG